jgi:hypothetical protein
MASINHPNAQRDEQKKQHHDHEGQAPWEVRSEFDIRLLAK